MTYFQAKFEVHPVIFHPSTSALLLIFLSLFMGCNPTYHSVRAHVPATTQAGQVQIDVGASQTDVTYAVTDRFAITAGGTYLFLSNDPPDNDEMDSSNDQDELPYLMKSSLLGGQLALSYQLPLNDQGSTLLSLSTGSAFQMWDYQSRTNSGYDGFKSFEARVINPFVQAIFIEGNLLTHIAGGLRVEKPQFEFDQIEYHNERLDPTQGKPLLFNFMIQGKYAPFSPNSSLSQLSLFTQFVWRLNTDSKHFAPLGEPDINPGYSISSWNFYLGLSYAFDPSQSKPTDAKSSSVTVEYTSSDDQLPDLAPEKKTSKAADKEDRLREAAQDAVLEASQTEQESEPPQTEQESEEEATELQEPSVLPQDPEVP